MGKKRRLLNIHDALETPRATQTLTLRNLTPRSCETCLRTGIQPEELQEQQLDDFEASTNEVRKIMYESYVLDRKNVQREIITEYERVVLDFARACDEDEQEQKCQDAGQPATGKDIQKLDYIEKEKVQLRRLQERQRKEVEQMLTYEMRQMELREAADRRLEADRKRSQQKKRIEAAKRRQQLEQKRLKLLSKQAMAKIEERQRMVAGQRMLERERQMAMEKKKKEMLRAQVVAEQERLKRKKVEDLRAITEANMEMQKQQALLRRQEIEGKEKQREELMQQKMVQQQQLMAKRRFDAKRRVDLNNTRMKKIIRKQTQKVKKKQRLVEARQVKQKYDNDVEREAHRMEEELKEEKRKYVMEQTKKEKKKRVDELIYKVECTGAIEILRQKQKEQIELKKANAAINAKRRADVVKRRQRKEDFKRKLVQDDIVAQAKRTEAMVREKDKLINRRVAMAVKNRMSKDRIIQTMEKIKIQKNWSAAETLLSRNMVS